MAHPFSLVCTCKLGVPTKQSTAAAASKDYQEVESPAISSCARSLVAL